ncbi:transcription cofactor vestigial-like protein 1 [Erpetoichthys calabaricus]|uniref:transcription cofactor vestigial-like protein 1 n=1 Tax=Erpetoichthys calabaricus TaxID=27687 RepID=UPI0022342671|nr:transcription cofactor vestigial-like protein 1 [Erpetoichthys calabaricus]XP_028671630.2 transcription cofactor vestigial-like protein 1 [Erpetoichthys calabaricus]
MEEDLRPSPSGVEQLADASGQSRSVLFTYFQGDINSVVDEHFSRALNKVNKPKDLSIKGKNSKMPGKESTSDPSVPVPWSFPVQSWIDNSYPPPSSSRIHFSSPANLHPHSEGLPSTPNQPPGLWALPGRSSSNSTFGVPPSVYAQAIGQDHPAGVSERQYASSFLNLLHSEKVPVANNLDAASKSQVLPSWEGNKPSALGSGLTLDSGIHSQDKGKNIYWY